MFKARKPYLLYSLQPFDSAMCPQSAFPLRGMSPRQDLLSVGDPE